jgi:hypothetical protein
MRSQVTFDLFAQPHQSLLQQINTVVYPLRCLSKFFQQKVKHLVTAGYFGTLELSHSFPTLDQFWWKRAEIVDHLIFKAIQARLISCKSLASSHDPRELGKDYSNRPQFHVRQLLLKIVNGEGALNDQVVPFHYRKNEVWVRNKLDCESFHEFTRLSKRGQLTFYSILFPTNKINSQLPLDSKITDDCRRNRHCGSNYVASEPKPVGPASFSADANYKTHPNRKCKKGYRRSGKKGGGGYHERGHFRLHIQQLPSPRLVVERDKQ